MKPAASKRFAEVPVTALHASSIRAMSEFVRQPSAELAAVVVRLLDALAEHPDRFAAPCGHNVYRHALEVWQGLVAGLAHAGDGAEHTTLH